MRTGEEAYEIGIAQKDKSIISEPKRNCPVFLGAAEDTLIFFNKENFQYKKDIQVEAAIKGHINLRESPYIKKYTDVMDKIEFGNNPDISISFEDRTKRDFFEFAGKTINGSKKFSMGANTRDGLYAISQRINIDTNTFDFMAYTIGYKDLLSSVSPELLNAQNKELLRILTNECMRIEKYLKLRTLHKIIEHCPIEIDMDNKILKWSV